MNTSPISIDFDAYIIAKASDYDIILKKCVFYIKKNIACRNIFVVTSKQIEEKVLALGCKFLDEDSIYKDLSYASVEKYLDEKAYIKENAGWYLQQFIKCSLAYISQNEYYLVWDADTFPVSPISFFDQDGKPFLNLKREYFGTYFSTIEHLFGYKKKTEESFISEHMLFNKNIMIEMLEKISNNCFLRGENFWQKIIFACDISVFAAKKNQRPFSEYETYGTYLDYNYPELYSKRKLRTLRTFFRYVGSNPDEKILDWAGKDFDTVSIETSWVSLPSLSYTRRCCRYFSKLIFLLEKLQDERYRQKHSFASFLKSYYKIIWGYYIKAMFFRVKSVKRFCNKIFDWRNFDFFFDDELSFKARKLKHRRLRKILALLKFIFL